MSKFRHWLWGMMPYAEEMVPVVQDSQIKQLLLQGNSLETAEELVLTEYIESLQAELEKNIYQPAGIENPTLEEAVSAIHQWAEQKNALYLNMGEVKMLAYVQNLLRSELAYAPPLFRFRLWFLKTIISLALRLGI